MLRRPRHPCRRKESRFTGRHPSRPAITSLISRHVHKVLKMLCAAVNAWRLQPKRTQLPSFHSATMRRQMSAKLSQWQCRWKRSCASCRKRCAPAMIYMRHGAVGRICSARSAIAVTSISGQSSTALPQTSLSTVDAGCTSTRRRPSHITMSFMHRVSMRRGSCTGIFSMLDSWRTTVQ